MIDISNISSLLIGCFAPLLVSLFKNPKWSDQQKMILTVITSIFLSALLLWISGKLDINNIAHSVGLVFTMSTITYKILWRYTLLNTTLEKTRVL